MADHNAIVRRFQGVENSPPATPEQREKVAELREKTLALALAIDGIEGGQDAARYRATALTELETAAMFAVKGVFH